MRPYIQSLLQDIASELIHKKPGYLLAAMTKLAEFFIAVLRLQPEGPVVSFPARHSNPKYQKVDEVAHYIVEHCTEQISLEDLAGRFYINKFYLSRIFKEVTSFTINDYLNVNRIKKPTGSFWKRMTASLPLRNSWAMKILLILNGCLKNTGI